MTTRRSAPLALVTLLTAGAALAFRFDLSMDASVVLGCLVTLGLLRLWRLLRRSTRLA